jgi:hypothetical protein
MRGFGIRDIRDSEASRILMHGCPLTQNLVTHLAQVRSDDERRSSV